jgi:guanine deaminase
MNQYMAEAIRLSENGMRNNEGGPFGAVVVKDGKIIGRGNNRVIETNDPTAHAEVTAIRDACSSQHTFDLSGCEIYTSCEPCPMCLAAIYWAHIEKIYFACNRYDAASIGFADDHIYHEMKLDLHERKIPLEQLMHGEAKRVFEEWMKKDDKTLY